MASKTGGEHPSSFPNERANGDKPNGDAKAVKRKRKSSLRVEPGCHPDIVYANSLSPWRDWCRRRFVAHLDKESKWIADFQDRVRTPFLDRYFYWSAIFGTHTFFTAFLPMLFFFNYPEKARGLLHVVGFGIYASCVLKDLVCTPRPYSPPVDRLSVSTHHREYGFPSSHATNASSIAFYVSEWVWDLREAVGYPVVFTTWAVMLVYFLSVAGGRLYSGMHTRVDIVAGTFLGIGCCVLWGLLEESTEAWVNSGTMMVPIVMVPLTLALVHLHPETPDDCPCFEDAIAIISVVLGTFLGHLDSVLNPIDLGPSILSHGVVWAGFIALCRIVVGITIIFVWRLIAKTTLFHVLPPLFRVVSKILDMPLPTRPFYTPATAYQGHAEAPIRTIPSFGNLRRADSSDSLINPDSATTATDQSTYDSDGGLQMRKRSARNASAVEMVDPGSAPVLASIRGGKQAHYDAEVLTKYIVYSGIGLLGGRFCSVLFRLIERHFGLL